MTAVSTAEPTATGPTVAVAICTFRRDQQLTDLLRRISSLAATEVPGRTVNIVVVDDSPEGDAATVIEQLRPHLGLEVTYHNTASADIAVARNCALELALERGEFIACLDDDCVPAGGWLRELLLVATECNADIVVGHRSFFANEGAPGWLSSQPFLDENLLYPDRSVPTLGNTANVLLRSTWLRASGIRFRADLGKVGGEDMVFFADARAFGAEIRFAANSVSNEPCDGHRTSYKYQLWRQIWLGNNEAAINRATGEVSTGRLLLRGSKRTAMGLVHPVRRMVHQSTPQWRWAVALSGSGLGLVLGVLGVRLRHRS